MIDTHAHLTSEELIDDVELLLERAKHVGLKYIVNICTDRLSLERGVELAKKHTSIFNAAATTPHDVEQLGEADFDFFAKAARNHQLLAIGETGLDYYYEHSQRPLQCEFLTRYLHLAKECRLPVIFHCREAFSDLFSITRSHAPECRALLHCFTGDIEEAHEAISRGWMISMSGIVTFKKSRALQEVAKRIPVEHLVVETDSPYLAPQSKRGKRNEPSFISETVRCLAELKGLTEEELSLITCENAKRFFEIVK